MGIIVMLPTLMLLLYLFWRDREAGKSISDERYIVPCEMRVSDIGKIGDTISMPKNQEIKRYLDLFVMENFDVPLIHSTEHNTTIYAHKAAQNNEQ